MTAHDVVDCKNNPVPRRGLLSKLINYRSRSGDDSVDVPSQRYMVDKANNYAAIPYSESSKLVVLCDSSHNTEKRNFQSVNYKSLKTPPLSSQECKAIYSRVYDQKFE